MDNETHEERATVSVDVESDVDQVWEALTTDDGVSSWIGAGSTAGSEPGDDMVFNDVVTGETRRGVIDTVSPGRELAYTWWSDEDPEHSSRVSITLVPCEIGTRVTVVEQLVASASATAWQWRGAMLAVSRSAASLNAVYA